MSPVVESVHEQYAKGRRTQVLAAHFADLIPQSASVIDVGTGDGSIAASVQAARPDVSLHGLEYQVRDDCAIPVEAFDGKTLPLADDSVDYVSFLDVLHHTVDPMVLLKEAKRVARRGLIIKDHLRQGFLGGSTLRFMDRVGNRRYGIELPNTYLAPDEWESAWKTLGLEAVEWRGDLGIYPAWADWWFGRGLHFFARLEHASQQPSEPLEYWHAGLSCVNERWESAYNRFETPSEERKKFARRFKEMGIDQLPRDAALVDIFCGRGNGLVVLSDWGFRDLTGVDLSPELLEQCPGSARRIVADCRELKFEPESIDAFIVQGGLHHLPSIPDDLEACLKEVFRSLKPGGTFYVVEPWNTVFLQVVHTITRSRPARALFPRFDAFATLVEEEWETYHQWLTSASVIETVFRSVFPKSRITISWGKCRIIARKSRKA
jgi:ubiquinone/menaquinone biosynthesis C-methylase UbiE